MDGTYSGCDDDGDGIGDGVGGHDDEMAGNSDGDGVDESSTTVSKVKIHAMIALY